MWGTNGTAPPRSYERGYFAGFSPSGLDKRQRFDYFSLMRPPLLASTLFLLLASALLATAWAADKQADDWFRKKTLVIPKKVEGLQVNHAEEVVLFTVKVRNAGTTTIDNYKVSGGCACFLHADGVGPIAPGETRAIDLWFDTEKLTHGKSKGTRSIYWVKQSGAFAFRYGKTKLYWSAR